MLHHIKTTRDGSHTLFVPELNEHYHSTNGAIQESNHVFIGAGLRYGFDQSDQVIKHQKHKQLYYQKAGNNNQSNQDRQLQKHKNENQSYSQQMINILEIGFGTGLNALLTLLEAEKMSKQLFYQAIELYPISTEEVQKLNYPSLLPQQEKVALFFRQLHTSPWEKEVNIGSNFTLLKQKIDFSRPHDFVSDRLFNLVYFDAFAPEKQREMWTQEIFNRIYALCEKDAILTTYCAKGAVRRMLKAAGFSVERLPGPPGKREILRGKIV